MDGRARVSFAWGGRFEFGELHFTPEAGGPAKRLTLDGRTRGTVTVPGNGFLAVRNTEAWTLERCGQGH